MDYYMASIQKQMLGSEAARALRSKGFEGIIVGLSANDMEDAFLAAGADFFMFKPFPCDQDPLKRELSRILNSERGDDLA
jgi:CheY-like chemotaxis protein